MASDFLGLLSALNGYGQGNLQRQQTNFSRNLQQQALGFKGNALGIKQQMADTVAARERDAAGNNEAKYQSAIAFRLQNGDIDGDTYNYLRTRGPASFSNGALGTGGAPPVQTPSVMPAPNMPPSAGTPSPGNAMPPSGGMPPSGALPTPTPSPAPFNPTAFGNSLASFVGGSGPLPSTFGSNGIGGLGVSPSTTSPASSLPSTSPGPLVGGPPAGGLPLPGNLSPNARLKQSKTQTGIDYQNWKMQQDPPGAEAARARFAASLPDAMSKISLQPPGQQPGLVQNLIANGKSLGLPMDGIQVPGSQNGTRPLNYGLTGAPLAAVGQARQILSQTTDPNATVNIGGKQYTRQQFTQAFPDGTAPTYAPFLTPNAKDAATIQNTTTRTDFIGKNFGLAQDRFTNQKAYQDAQLKLRAQALQYQKQGLTDREVQNKIAEDIASGRLSLDGMKFQHSLTVPGGGAGGRPDPLNTEYERNMARITLLTKPTTSDLYPGKLFPPTLSPQGQQEVQHLMNRNHAIRVQQQSTPLPTSGTSLFSTVPAPITPPVGSGNPSVFFPGYRPPPGLGPLPTLGGSPTRTSAPPRRGKLDLSRFLP